MTEAELCALFKPRAEGDGWRVYPEISGWDLVLVWTGDAPVPAGATEVYGGDQIGIEAKLRANVKALHQAVTRRGTAQGGEPDFRAVLVPKASVEFIDIAARLGVGVFTLRHCGRWTYRRRGWERPRKTISAPKKRHPVQTSLWLPPIVPDGNGGEPCGRGLTPWRVKALKMMVLIRAHGHCTSADFDTIGINMQTWKEHGWIIADNRLGRSGRRRRYRLNLDHPDLPDRGFETDRDRLAELEAVTALAGS